MKQATSSRQREKVFRAQRGKRSDAPLAGSPTTPAPAKVSWTKRRHFLGQYLRWLGPYRWSLGGLFVLSLITAGMDMVWPLGIKSIIGVLLNPGMPRDRQIAQINIYGAVIVAVLVAKQLIDTARSYRTTILNSKVVFRLRRRLYDALLRLPFSGLADMKSGGIVSRLSGDIDSASGLVQSAILSPGVALIRVVLTTVILFALSWRLAVAAMILLPFMGSASFLWLRLVRPIYRSIRDDTGHIDGRVNETFGGIRVVRAFRREPREQRGYAVGHHTIIRKSLFAERMELVLAGVWGLLIPATSLVIVWYGARLVLRGIAQVGDIFAFQIYAALLLQPVWAIVGSISQTQRAMAAMERVFEVLEMPPDKPDAPNAAAAPRVVEELRFDHVDFEYRTGVPVIHDFTLAVPGGSTVALVGPSGAGKTTITDLVARFHDPTSGALFLNGTDLRKLTLRSYRSLLAIVQQETFLFDGTVRENILYGRRQASEEDVRDAARRANADDFIRQLPEGYDTLIGERGFKLSGGQKQRLSIARAILADPQILILDEATSNLDTESEQLIQSALSDLFIGRTTFVIAHRLSTITHANIIVVMDQGKIREAGSHAQLMEQRGFYFEMVERQRQSFGAEISEGAVSELIGP